MSGPPSSPELHFVEPWQHAIPCTLIGCWIWKIHFTQLPMNESAYLGLSNTEEQKARSIRHPSIKQRFCAGRQAIRHILGQHIHQAPVSLEFTENAHGRLALCTPHHPLISFNLSHCEEFSLLVVSDRYHVGVDVEQIDPSLEPIPVGEGVFDAREMAYLYSLEGDERLKGFYRLWTIKEAVLKLMGTGFSLEAKHVHVLSALKQAAGQPIAAKQFADPQWGFPDGIRVFLLPDCGDKPHFSALALADPFTR